MNLYLYSRILLVDRTTRMGLVEENKPFAVVAVEHHYDQKIGFLEVAYSHLENLSFSKALVVEKWN